MLTNLPKKIELVANLAIITVACLLVTVLAKDYLLSRPSNIVQDKPSANEPAASNSFSVSSLGIEWKSRQTLLLILSSECHYCTESAPFYKRIIQNKGETRIVAVMPQGVIDGQKYLERLGISVDEIKQSALSNLGVRGTPTLLLVDESGTIKESWLGKLPSEQEPKVLAFLR